MGYTQDEAVMRLILAVLVFCGVSHAGYTWSKSLTTNTAQVTSDLTNFPVTVRVTSDTIRGLSLGGAVTKSAIRTPYDLVFSTDAAGASLLKWEIEFWDSTAGVLVAHVLLPTAHTATPDVFYLCVGNAAITTWQGDSTGVWTPNYAAVIHLRNGTTLNADDASGAIATGTITGATAVAGVVDGSARIASTSQTIYWGNVLNHEMKDVFTEEIWFFNNSGANNGNIFTKQQNSGGFLGGGFQTTSGGNIERFWYNGTGCNVGWGAKYADSAYHHLVFTSTGSVANTCNADTGTYTLYNNGSVVTKSYGTVSGSGTVGSTAVLQLNGRGGASIGSPMGAMKADEIRVSNAAFSAAYISAEYNTMRTGSTFLTYGAFSGGSTGLINSIDGAPIDRVVAKDGATKAMIVSVDGSTK